ncbi:patatin-like protein [Lentzea albidocapillata]|uniref:Patatin-related protein n=1 Tax=Lentzea albidocapillata TaxID=40571 RepID=A0A1W2FND4_9PSEU|nr:patatin-like protein [Lentzea albidocapillata]SMD23212.1 patatin-related protein [Lentzea albidocapillata]
MSEQPMSREEVRFAVVLNGGVSLAVWMGGVVLELDRLTRPGSVYQPLLDLVGCTARADVIAGTSAGGINGAALALSQVNKQADLTRLRDLWAEQGRMEQLLRTPFRGQPGSLLKGDEFFLPRLQEALARLTADFRPTEPDERPIDLRITTTLLGGVPAVTYDDLGQPLTQSVHQGSFSFRRDPYNWVSEETRDDFAAATLDDRVLQLALAARSSASFPFAFEPSFIPVGGQSTPDRPDMADVASWANGGDRSRFAVDGGVLVNTPTKEALEAIDRMPADGPVRRVMLLVFPHAEPLGSEPVADTFDRGPTTVGSGGRLLGAMSSQAGRTYVEKIEEHNRRAAGSRGGRMALLERLHTGGEDVVGEVYSLADKLFGHYEDVEIRLAARQVTAQQFALSGGNPANWSFERARRAAETAQRKWKKLHGVLPYVPGVRLPGVVCREDVGWEWGITMAERLGASALDLLKRLVWVVPEAQADEVTTARRELHRVRAELRGLREELFDWKPSDSLGETYWTGRLASYHEHMIDGQIGLRVREQVAEIGRVVGAAQQVITALDEHRLKLGGLVCWHALLDAPAVASEAGLGDGERWLSRLLALEIAGTCLSDDASTGMDSPVELVQVSLQTRNAFAKQSLTADDKAGGASLSRFSGFLKRSWRVNDWIWGRLDGATMLCRVLFDPRRLRRMDLLGRPADDRRTAEERAQAVVDQVVTAMFGLEMPLQVAACAEEAKKELTGIYETENELSPSSMKLAELAAWGLHWRIICEELPRLRAAIIADRGDGADRRSRGELFLEEHADLLRRLEYPQEHTVTLGMSALNAFDRAGIGREPLTQEAASDQMIRTAATAAAVAVTVADSERSGLAAVRPVTRVLRGCRPAPLLDDHRPDPWRQARAVPGPAGPRGRWSAGRDGVVRHAAGVGRRSGRRARHSRPARRLRLRGTAQRHDAAWPGAAVTGDSVGGHSRRQTARRQGADHDRHDHRGRSRVRRHGAARPRLAALPDPHTARRAGRLPAVADHQAPLEEGGGGAGGCGAGVVGLVVRAAHQAVAGDPRLGPLWSVRDLHGAVRRQVAAALAPGRGRVGHGTRRASRRRDRGLGSGLRRRLPRDRRRAAGHRTARVGLARGDRHGAGVRRDVAADHVLVRAAQRTPPDPRATRRRGDSGHLPGRLRRRGDPARTAGGARLAVPVPDQG